MSKKIVTLSIEESTYEKMRKHYPNEISRIVQDWMEKEIQQIEGKPNTPINKPFQIHKDGEYWEYSPGKFVDQKGFDRARNEIIAKGIEITPSTLSSVLNAPPVKVPSRSGTWPGKEGDSLFDEELKRGSVDFSADK